MNVQKRPCWWLMLLNSIRNHVPHNVRNGASCEAGSRVSVWPKGFLGNGNRKTRWARRGLPACVHTVVSVCVCVRVHALYPCARVWRVRGGGTADCAKDPGAVAGFWAEQLHDLTWVLPGSLDSCAFVQTGAGSFFLWLAGILWMWSVTRKNFWKIDGAEKRKKVTCVVD